MVPTRKAQREADRLRQARDEYFYGSVRERMRTSTEIEAERRPKSSLWDHFIEPKPLGGR